MIWETSTDSAQWDADLSRLGGHPLQSAVWGDARRIEDGLSDCRWQAREGSKIVWMARVEERRAAGVARVAWIPRGPTASSSRLNGDIDKVFLAKMREAGFMLVVSDRWVPIDDASRTLTAVAPKTIWLDLGRGAASLWQELDKQWRYGVGRARREGVICESTGDDNDIASFFSLCREISSSKGFQLPGSLGLISRLLKVNFCADTSAHLFVARVPEGLAAGACILRCGRSIHYFWGASDRRFSKYRAGEALQWTIIEWGIERGCLLYDLEGIDPVQNPGVYEFKKKMGGRIVSLEGMRYHPLNLGGRLICGARRVLRQ
jgi:hypothetical protein